MLTLTIHQLSRATDLTRYTIDQWISRGYFQPSQPSRPGRPRTFTFGEAIILGAMAELTRLGIDPKAASRVTAHLHGFRDTEAILLIWQGPAELVPTTPRGSEPLRRNYEQGKAPTIPENANRWYDPNHPPLHACIVKPDDLTAAVGDPDKRAIALVNLDAIEARVTATLNGDDESEGDA